MKAQDIIDRRNRMARDKEPFKTLWQEIGELMAPNKADFNRVFGIGQKRQRRIWDGTPIHAADIFASSILGIVANPASRWFNIGVVDEDINEDQEASEWLDIAGKITLNHINQAQAKFYGHMKNVIRNMGVLGTSGLSVMPGRRTELEFQPVKIGKLDILQDSAGYVDSKYRTQKFTARQLRIKEADGWELHPKVLASKPEEKFEIIHAFFPREERGGFIDGKNKPFASIWVDVKNDHIMFEGGFDEDAIPIGRWDLTDGDEETEVWGRGQGEVALADVQLLYVGEQGMMIAMEKQINPVLQVFSDGTYGALDLSPGAINVVSSKDGRGAEILESTGSLPIALDWLESKRNSIRIAFFVDQLQIISQTQRTATEVLRELDEKSRLLAPNIGMVQSEIIGPVVERCVKILIRAGKIPPPPPIFEGQEMKIVYISPLSRAQREPEALATLEFMQNMIGVAGIRPDILDKIDFDAMVEEVHDISGVPEKILNTDEEVLRIRQAREQQAQAQQQAAGIEQAAGIAKTANEAGLFGG
jgi:hypothetical protein